jgi:hypothetical protein
MRKLLPAARALALILFPSSHGLKGHRISPAARQANTILNTIKHRGEPWHGDDAGHTRS